MLAHLALYGPGCYVNARNPLVLGQLQYVAPAGSGAQIASCKQLITARRARKSQNHTFERHRVHNVHAQYDAAIFSHEFADGERAN